MLAPVSHLNSREAQHPDHIAPEFIVNCGALMLNWLRGFFSQCMYRLRLQKAWRHYRRPDAKNYRQICVLLKLVDHLLLSRLDPVIDPQLPPEQDGFRHGRSTTDHVTFLTYDIEAGFEHVQQVHVALVDLPVAYDTVWLYGLHLNLLRMLHDRHIVLDRL